MSTASPLTADNQDGLTKAIADYMRRIDRGEQVDHSLFLEEHAAIADELGRYFDDVALVEQLAGPTLAEQSHSAGQTPAERRSRRDTVSVTQSVDSVPEKRRKLSGCRLSGSFGRYQIEKTLGEGAMGTVYLAHDDQLDRRVALKVPKFKNDDPEMTERFYREARSAATLRHRNICPVYDIGEIDGVRFISMAYIAGRPLSAFVSPDKPQTERNIAVIIRKLAIALEAAHHEGVVHRDLKPPNIMVDEKKEPVIMDFGLARQMKKGENVRLTQSGAVMGSPAYMSPEQVNGEIDRVGPCSDVYSLGVILYELLTGRLPFDGSIAAVLGQILMTEPSLPSEFRSDLDPRLEAICTKMMSKKIEDRYTSMQDVATALTDFLKNKGKAHGLHPVGSLESLASFDPVELEKLAQATAADELEFRPTNRHRPQQQFTKTILGKRSAAKPVANSMPDATARFPGWAWGIVGAFAALLLVWGVVVLFQVGDQTIRVEIADNVRNDPNLKLYLDGKQLKIDGLGKTIELKVGPHDWTVKQGNLTVHGPEQFIVSSAGNEVLKISVDSELVVKTDTTSRGSAASGNSIARGSSSRPLNLVDAPPLAIAPFDAVTAKKHQEAWADHLGLPVEKDVDIGGGVKISTVLIPPGEFMMGSTEDAQSRFLKEMKVSNYVWSVGRIPIQGPQHRVSITQPFAISRHEVTRGQFRQFVKETGYKTDAERDGKGGFAYLDRKYIQDARFVWNADPGFTQTDDHPVVNVSWNDAMAFCQWLSKKQDVTYHLPSEAQWEYACRAGTQTLWHCADSQVGLQQHAWLKETADGETHPVGRLRSNGFGVFDMHGNVWEWCADWYAEDFYAQSPTNDPTGRPTGSHRVFRGGSYTNGAGLCRSAFRGISSPGDRCSVMGFRLAMTIDSAKQAGPTVPAKQPQNVAVVPAGTAGPTALKQPISVDLLSLLPKLDQRLIDADGKRQLRVQVGSNVAIDYAPPEEYDLYVTLRRYEIANKKRDRGFAVYLPVGTQNRVCDAYIDGQYGYGLRLDGKSYRVNETHKSLHFLNTGRSHQVIYRVRRSSISVVVNGRTVIDWKDNFDRLPFAPDAKRHVVFRAHNARFDVSEARLVPYQAEPENVAVVPGGSTSLQFDGVDSHVVIRSLRFDGKPPWTLEAVVTPHRINSDRVGWMTLVGDLNFGGIGLLMLDRHWEFRVGGPPASPRKYKYVRAVSEKFATADNRAHVAGVWDGEEVRLYINGKLQIRTSYQGRPSISGLPFVIGADPSKKGKLQGLFKGIIEELRVSNTARYTTDFVPQDRFEPDKQALVLYHFDEGQGTVLKDASGNGNDGNIVAAKWIVASSQLAGPTVPATGEWVDLIPDIDPKRDAIGSEWVKTGGTLQLKSGDGGNYVKLSAKPRGSYEVELEFTRHVVLPNHGVALLIPAGNRRVSAVFSGFVTQRVSGLSYIDGLHSGQRNSPCRTNAFAIERGKRHKAHVRVVVDGAEASIEATIDGRKLFAWSGAISRLSHPVPVPDGNILLSCVGYAKATVHALRWRQIVDVTSETLTEFQQLAAGEWTPVFTKAADVDAVPNARMLAGGVIELVTNGRRKFATVVDSSVAAADVVLRAKVKKKSGEYIVFKLRHGPSHNYAIHTDGTGKISATKMTGGSQQNLKTLTDSAGIDHSGNEPFLSFEMKNQEWDEWVVLARGNRMTAWVNGLKVIEFTDDEVTSGAVALGSNLSNVQFKDVEVQVLKPAAGMVAKKPSRGKNAQQQAKEIAALIDAELKKGNFGRGKRNIRKMEQFTQDEVNRRKKEGLLNQKAEISFKFDSRGSIIDTIIKPGVGGGGGKTTGGGKGGGSRGKGGGGGG